MTALTHTLCDALVGRTDTRIIGQDWPVDRWCRLVAEARGHGVDGLLLRAFSKSGWPEAMPDETREELRASIYEGTGHSLKLYTALAPVLRAVTPITPVIVLKGAALGASHYPNPSLRPLVDLDLLVPEQSVDAVTAALVDLGYTLLPSVAPELRHAAEPHVSLLGGPGGDVMVEVHWALVCGHDDWRAVPVDWFWQQTEGWQPPPAFLATGGSAEGVRRLTDTAALLYQAAHLVLQHGHEPARLIWLYDLHLLVSHGRIDWDLLRDQARKLRWEAILHKALEQTASYFHTALPADQLESLSHELDSRVVYVGPEATYTPLGSWGIAMRLRPLTRLHMLLRLVAPSPAYLRSVYEPAWGRWWPLAYPYRWLKPLGRLARRVAGRTPARCVWPR